MNTKWKEEFKEKFKHSQFVNYSAIKAFIQDQITKAQQEIAEQIIEDIPDDYILLSQPVLDGSRKVVKIIAELDRDTDWETNQSVATNWEITDDLKDELRIKYLNESEKV